MSLRVVGAALDVPVPSEPFPRTNTSGEFRARFGWDQPLAVCDGSSSTLDVFEQRPSSPARPTPPRRRPAALWVVADDQHGEVLDEHLFVLVRGPASVQDEERVQLG